MLWSYGGWQHATFTAGEAINPKKDLPRAMITAAVAVTLIYILVFLETKEINSSQNESSPNFNPLKRGTY